MPRKASETATATDADDTEFDGGVIQLPKLVELPERVHRPRSVETWLPPAERDALKRLQQSLDEAGETTSDGKPINRPGRVVRWLLAQVGKVSQ